MHGSYSQQISIQQVLLSAYKENYTEIVTGFTLLPCYMMGLNTKEREEKLHGCSNLPFLKVTLQGMGWFSGLRWAKPAWHCRQRWLLLLLSRFSRVRLWPHRRQPTRLPRPWDSPGKNTGMGCHFLLQGMKVNVKSLSRVWLLATPWTAAYQAPPPMVFSRQEYWSGLPSPSLQAKVVRGWK